MSNESVCWNTTYEKGRKIYLKRTRKRIQKDFIKALFQMMSKQMIIDGKIGSFFARSHS